MRNNNPGAGNLLAQQLAYLETYEAQSTCDALVNVFEWLEKYVERTGRYPDWITRKQVNYDRQIEIQRQDRNTISIEDAKKTFATVLFAFRNVKQNQQKPEWFLDDLKSQFFIWIDGSGVNVSNCDIELAECLIDIYEVLTTEGNEFAYKRETQASAAIAKMSIEEKKKHLTELFLFRDYYDKQEEKRESLQGQTIIGNDIIKDKFRFNGNEEQGRKTFEQILKAYQNTAVNQMC